MPFIAKLSIRVLAGIIAGLAKLVVSRGDATRLFPKTARLNGK